MGNGVTWDKTSVKLKKNSRVKIFKPIKNFRISLTLQGFILETSLIVIGSSKNPLVTFYVLNNNFFYSQVAFNDICVCRKNLIFSVRKFSTRILFTRIFFATVFFIWTFSRISLSELPSSESEDISISSVI